MAPHPLDPLSAAEIRQVAGALRREDGDGWRLALIDLREPTIDEYHEADVALRKDARVIGALAARGITDLDLVLIDTWAFGAHLLPEEHRDRRLGWADVWRRAEHGANPYANPVTGLHLVVDLDAMELVEIEDDGAIDEPAPMGEYVPRLV